MTDDIVERLRYVAKIKSNLDRDKELIAQAADEIERLRKDSAELDRLTIQWNAARTERVEEFERLRALLREPTPEMLDAAEQYNREHITGEWSFADCYRAMTRRALEPKP